MSKNRFMLRCAVYLMLIKDGKVLLIRRFNTGWEDGKYTFVTGHIDGNETIRQAMAREAQEEIGITIQLDDLQVVHTMHVKTNLEYIVFFLKPVSWKGVPTILEPDRCDDLGWFSLDALPEGTLPFVKTALEAYTKGVFYSEFGW